MDAARPSPFQVIDQPYVVWSFDPIGENLDFLNSIDGDFYHRTVQEFFCDEEGRLKFNTSEHTSRKDVSSFARLLWNHGLETLVMLIGAYVQAPHVVHGFFLKCTNEDCRTIAKYLLSGDIPRTHCLRGNFIRIDSFIQAINPGLCARNDVKSLENLSYSLEHMLREYLRDEHRAEYNSIKHGLRAHHGRFAIAIGLQEAPGIPAPEEAMTMISDSPEGSHFLDIRQFQNLPKKMAREHFSIRRRSVGWSLEKTLQDIQLFTLYISNIISSLKIAAGVASSDVKFIKPVAGEDWWNDYFNDNGPAVHNHSSSMIIEIPKSTNSAEIFCKVFYKNQDQRRES